MRHNNVLGAMLFIFSFLLFWKGDGLLYAQGFTEAFGGAAADQGNSIVQTTDGGYAMYGYTKSNPIGLSAGTPDFYFVKLNSAGAFQWSKNIGGNDWDMQAGFPSMVQTTDGGFVMAGRTFSFGDIGSYDMYVVKLSNAGAIQWTRTVGGASADEGYSIIQTTDGGYAVAGYTASYGAGGVSDIYVVKLNNAGALQWTRTVGTISAENGNSIIQTTDGGYVIAGQSYYDATRLYESCLVKLDNAGTLQWTNTVGTAGYDEYGNNVIQTTDGGYVVTGIKQNSPDNQIFIYKVDNSGTTLQWSRTIGTAGNDNSYSVIQTSDGGYLIAGNTVNAGTTDAYFVKLDNTGTTIQWTRMVGGAGTDAAVQVISTTDGGYVAAGYTNSFGAGALDMYIIKLDATGSSCASTGTGGTGAAAGAALNSPVQTAGSGGATSSGGSTGTGGALNTFCNSILPIELLYFNATPENNAFVKTEWSTATEINNDYFTVERSRDAIEFVQISTVQGAGNSSTIRNYEFTDADPYKGISYYRLKQTDYDGQFTYSPIRAVYVGATENIIVFPNPSVDGFIQYTVANNYEGEVTIKIFDVIGREVLSNKETLESGVNIRKLNIPTLGSGSYLFKITTKSQEVIQKQFLIIKKEEH